MYLDEIMDDEQIIYREDNLLLRKGLFGIYKGSLVVTSRELYFLWAIDSKKVFSVSLSSVIGIRAKVSSGISQNSESSSMSIFYKDGMTDKKATVKSKKFFGVNLISSYFVYWEALIGKIIIGIKTSAIGYSISRLEKAVLLRDSGLISEEEFFLEELIALKDNGKITKKEFNAKTRSINQSITERNTEAEKRLEIMRQGIEDVKNATFTENLDATIKESNAKTQAINKLIEKHNEEAEKRLEIIRKEIEDIKNGD